MSSHDRLRRRVVAAICIAALAGGCQVRPLYATSSFGSDGRVETVDALKQIAVEVQKDRVGQALMNALIFAFRGGSELQRPAYVLRLIVREEKTELAVRESEEVPAANLVALTVTFTLTQSDSRRVIAQGTAYDTVSYDFSTQRFANLRAQRDAENRAVQKIAEEIRMRVAAALAAP